jgi:type III restriction enzyme
MELREYQKKVVNKLSDYLVALGKQKERYEKLLHVDPELAGDFHYPKKAWEEIGRTTYKPARDGLNNPLPNLFLKVPTGGGKTLLACHSIDLINKLYLQKQNGMVLWIVPTKQIYDQTLKSLKDRDHPYRQLLDISSGGKTLILEKLDYFSAGDIEENLCVLVMMLQSSSRQSKETLKVFKDNTGYTNFFPEEDDYKSQEALLKEYPNLDTFGEQGYLYGNLPLTSLGNVMRLLKPITIIDEGHKAYSPTARDTIYGFNPSFVLELSATPPEGVNKLIEITGTELNDEQMIKLDLHLVNKNTVGWKETLSEATTRRNGLEAKAKEHEQNTNIYIRPIMLIQVERTGKDQKRDGVLIHAEDAKEYLIKQLAVPEEQIAIKSSDKDDIEGIDLLSKDSEIRYIITKQALQEGWDCPFAYVLCALTKSQSETAMTQLIGRVLRQPYARKTGIKELDECYVYSFQHDTSKLVRGIKTNLEGEGLGDVVGRISVDTNLEENPDYIPTKEMRYRDKFKHFEGKIYLPVFAIKSGNDWREVSYQADLMPKLDWNKIDLTELGKLTLENKTSDDDILSIGFSSGSLANAQISRLEYESEIDNEYIARQIVDVVPNPWVAYSVADRAVNELLSRYDKEVIASNLVFIIEELRKLLYEQRDVLSEAIFRQLLEDKVMKLYMLQGSANCVLPSSVIVRSKTRLNHINGEQLQQSLFDYMPAEDVNGLEEEVALYLDNQQQLLWWYRNMSRADYHIQGWKPNRIYPDFVAANKINDSGYDKLYVLETKGDQLAGNLDTEYKRNILNLCSELAVEKSWNEFDLGQNDNQFIFAMVDEKYWKSQLNTLIG